MAIKYVAYSWLGQKLEGVLQVEREEDARQALERDELIPYRLAPVRRRRSLVQLMPSLFKPPPKELIEFTRSMAALLKSGIPLRDALSSYHAQTRSLGVKEMLRRVIEDIEGGDTFSDACSRHPSVFPDFYVRLLRVGEATGGVVLTLERLLETVEKRKAVRDKVKAALIYPAISLAVAVVVGFILVSYALPSLVGLLKEYGGELPLATKLLISVSGFFQSYRLQIAAYALGGMAVLVGYLRTRQGGRVRDRVLLRVPVVGRVILHSNVFSLTSTFSTLMEAGVAPVESLQLSREGLSNVVLQERLAKVIAEASAGTSLGRAFQMHWPSPPLLSQGVITGEGSGNLPIALHALAEYYEQETSRAVSGATELIQPAVILGVGGLVGFVAVAVIAGIYSTIGSVK
jgi:type IV pilus assembly protein PilC